MSERLCIRDGVLADNVHRATTAAGRMKGLLGRTELQPGEALLLEPAAQVHTFGMRYPIDVVLCDRDLVVLRIVRGLRPMRVTRWVRGARVVFELPAGSLPGWLSVGERLTLTRDLV